MKLFILDQQDTLFDRMTGDMSQLIINLCERLLKRVKLDLVHTALFLFQCQIKICSFHNFDRYVYACAAILVASKLTENMEFYPSMIIKTLRALLRKQKGLDGVEDSEEKLKSLTKKLFQAEVNLMINIGFDFDLQLGVFWLDSWAQKIGDPHLLSKAKQALTSLYQTNTVVYFKPSWLALTSISIVMKQQHINLDLCKWDSQLIEFMKQHSDNIERVLTHFRQKKRYLYS